VGLNRSSCNFLFYSIDTLHMSTILSLLKSGKFFLIVFINILLSTSGFLWAQEEIPQNTLPKLYWTILAGPNFSVIETSSALSSKHKNHIGFSGKTYLNYRFNDYVEIGTGLGLSKTQMDYWSLSFLQKGAGLSGIHTVRDTLRFNSIFAEMPLFLRLRIGGIFSFFFEGGISVNAPVWSSGNWTTIITPYGQDTNYLEGSLDPKLTILYHTGIGFVFRNKYGILVNASIHGYERNHELSGFNFAAVRLMLTYVLN
jgi:hypothetical protein